MILATGLKDFKITEQSRTKKRTKVISNTHSTCEKERRKLEILEKTPIFSVRFADDKPRKERTIQ